jgi:hypothetical protein
MPHDHRPCTISMMDSPVLSRAFHAPLPGPFTAHSYSAPRRKASNPLNYFFEETKMNIRFAGLATFIGMSVLAAPIVSHADNTKGVDECIQAVIKNAVPAGYPVRVVKQGLERQSPQSIFMSAPTKIYVTARGEETGKIFGQATCVLNPRCTLVAVHMEPTDVRLADNSASTLPGG